MDIHVIKAEESHAHLLPGIERSAGKSFLSVPGYEWIASDTVMTAKAHLKLIGQGTVWLALGADDHVWGFLSAEACGDVLHIWEISVHQDAQGQGLGTRLIKTAEAYALEKAMRAVSLTTFRHVPFNAPYYERLGYAIMEDAALGNRLRSILADEAASGLKEDTRCAMVKPV